MICPKEDISKQSTSKVPEVKIVQTPISTQVIKTQKDLENWIGLSQVEFRNHQRTIDVMMKLRHIQAVMHSSPDLEYAKASLYDYNWDDLGENVMDLIIKNAKSSDFSSKFEVDPVAMGLFKKHFPEENNKYPILTSMNGFCLESSVSKGTTGTTNMELEYRLKVVKRMIYDSENLKKEADHRGWAHSYDSLFKEIKDICQFEVELNQFGTLNFNGEYSGMYSISGKFDFH